MIEERTLGPGQRRLATVVVLLAVIAAITAGVVGPRAEEPLGDPPPASLEAL